MRVRVCVRECVCVYECMYVCVFIFVFFFLFFKHQKSIFKASIPAVEGISVRENLRYAAELRIGSQPPFSVKERDAVVDEVIKSLGLSHIKDVLVSFALKLGDRAGISGGQLRRLSIAIQWIKLFRATNGVLLLDEPTSGLDAKSSVSVMNILHNLAHRGLTVALSIHQPRQEIYNEFDRILLLASGRMVFNGERAEWDALLKTARLEDPRMDDVLRQAFSPADGTLDLLGSPLCVELQEYFVKSSSFQKLCNSSNAYLENATVSGSTRPSSSSSFFSLPFSTASTSAKQQQWQQQQQQWQQQQQQQPGLGSQFQTYANRMITLFTRSKQWFWVLTYCLTSLAGGALLGSLFGASKSMTTFVVGLVSSLLGISIFTQMSVIFPFKVTFTLDHADTRLSSTTFVLQTVISRGFEHFFVSVCFLLTFFVVFDASRMEGLKVLQSVIIVGLFAKVCVNIHINMNVLTSGQEAAQMLSILMLALMGLFGGTFMPAHQLPSYYHWTLYFNPVYYAFVGLLRVNISNEYFKCDYDARLSYCLPESGNVFLSIYAEDFASQGFAIIMLMVLWVFTGSCAMCLHAFFLHRRNRVSLTSVPGEYEADTYFEIPLSSQKHTQQDQEQEQQQQMKKSPTGTGSGRRSSTLRKIVEEANEDEVEWEEEAMGDHIPEGDRSHAVFSAPAIWKDEEEEEGEVNSNDQTNWLARIITRS